MTDYERIYPETEPDPETYLADTTHYYASLESPDITREVVEFARQVGERIDDTEFEEVSLSGHRGTLYGALGDVHLRHGLTLPPGRPISAGLMLDARRLYAGGVADLIRAEAHEVDVPDMEVVRNGLWRGIVRTDRLLGDERAARYDGMHLPPEERWHERGGIIGRLGAASVALFNRTGRPPR